MAGREMDTLVAETSTEPWIKLKYLLLLGNNNEKLFVYLVIKQLHFENTIVFLSSLGSIGETQRDESPPLNHRLESLSIA